MKHDIDYIIQLMKKHTFKNDLELGEQDTPDAGASAGSTSTAGGAATSGGGQKNNVTTWSKIVGAKLVRSKNRLGNEKWESGVGRGGPGNQIAVTKWRDIVQPKRDGPANQLT